MPEFVEPIPFTIDSAGTYRIGGTRVTLDSVIGAFHRGSCPEQIIWDYDSLKLADVYLVIGYYLRHREELDRYLADAQAAAERLFAEHPEWSPPGLKERLLARKASAA